ncbi:MAG: glycoside hydrolase family 5 protein [Anaerolineae bacterium]|nr:glycoside hydrolase family 5 protein [Anaerolineae bacterium]
MIRRTLILFLVGLIFLGCQRVSRPQGPLDPHAQAQRLGRGVNLGNALEAPEEGEWGMTLEEEFFVLIGEAGFDTIRVPIRWSAHALEESPYTIDEDFFARVDWVIEHAHAQDLNVVINMHHYDEIFEDPDTHGERFIEMWKQIATRYKDRPDTLYFEPLNEPHGNLDANRWNILFADTVAAIREIDAYHTLVAGGADWNGIDGLAAFDPPAGESNLIGTFHFYEPYLFTHQGAEWGGPEVQTLGIVWPGPPETKVEIADATRKVEWARTWLIRYNGSPSDSNPAGPKEIGSLLDRAAAWSEERNIPLWMGEFGAYSTADMPSRVRWTTFVREEAEGRGFSWSYWEFGAGFGVYDRDLRRWNEALLTALIPE